jgi:anaphase-promoting complex subunit 8
MGLTATDVLLLREALQIAVVKCSERCLYQAAKWYQPVAARELSHANLHRAAELLDALPESSTTEDRNAADKPGRYVHPALSPNADPEEVALEAKELNKYLLAKALFDCKEYDRCAAVFLPDSLLAGLLSAKPEDIRPSPRVKGKQPAAAAFDEALPEISQKSLFLALYAKVLSGEKRKDEDSETVMGPQDLGATVNKQLLVVSRFLHRWFNEGNAEGGERPGSQGFLEYL